MTKSGAHVKCTKNPIAAICVFIFVLTRFEVQIVAESFIIWPKQTGLDEIQTKMYKVKTLRARKHIHNIFEPGAPSWL